MGKVGFIGLGIMGKAMAANLINAGYDVMVWNRTQSKCEELVDLGGSSGDTPADIVKKCDYTFCMLADPQACLDTVFGEEGILKEVCAGKSIIDMSTVDAETSKKISSAITEKGGRFLEGPVSGSKKPAEMGQLIILAGGDEDLFREAVPMFEILGKKSVYLGEVGNGAKMKLVVNMLMGSMTSAFCEALGLCEKSGLKQEEFLDVLSAGAINSPWYAMKGKAALEELFKPEDVQFPLKHMQKDIRLALELGDEVGQRLSVANETNELFKEAIEDGCGDCDVIAIHPTIVSKKL